MGSTTLQLTRGLLLVVVCVVPACRPKTSPAQAAETRSSVERVRAHGFSLDARRRAALSKTDLVPRPDLGACPIAVPRVSSVAAPFDIAAQEARETRMGLVTRDGGLGLAGTPGPMWSHVMLKLRTIESDLQPQQSYSPPPAFIGEELVKAAHDLEAEKWDWDLVVVIDAVTWPQASEVGFVPGSLKGRGYVYDYAKEVFVCAASVEAESSESVSVSTTTLNGIPTARSDQHDLNADLTQQALVAAIAKLTMAGPPQKGQAPW